MLDELGNLGDFIGGIAVVATLVYLAIQIRHNTAATRVQAMQQLLTSDTTGSDSILAGPIPEIVGKLEAEEMLSATEVAAFTFFMRGRLTDAWQVFYQRESGMIEHDVADILLARVEYWLRLGMFHAIWHATLKAGFPTEFQQWVESRLEKLGGRGDD